MTILVTGGAGYIGSHTVARLVEQGREVVVVDSMELGHRQAIGEVALIEADVADTESMTKVITDFQVDSVIHFAAYKAAGESVLEPGKYFRNNTAGTTSLLETLRTTGVDKVVFSSTCAVYGTPGSLPVSEAESISPESPYGESKAAVERILGWYDRCHGIRSVPLRYFNAAGASLDASIGEGSALTLNLVPLVMQAALGQRVPLRVFGTDYPTPDGTNIRDYVHVVDLADAHLRALEYLEAGYGSTTVNLGTGHGSSVLEVIDSARRASGVPVPVVLTERRPGDPVALYADTAKAADVLGWTARYGLDEIVSTAWAWHSAHPDGYPPAA
ncbi:MAG: UDP-glucose 4-epimerase GalE [Actinomycetota bacterium]|nr:UDP-glucose 4-epimerase GalE [Actinomycetota bacterium]MDQ6944870.1 UDP-glucose 4-epimerase GalE [Actinomycetota bacterium]